MVHVGDAGERRIGGLVEQRYGFRRQRLARNDLVGARGRR